MSFSCLDTNHGIKGVTKTIDETTMGARTTQQIAEEDYLVAVQQKLDDISRVPVKNIIALQLQWAPIIRDAYSHFDREREWARISRQQGEARVASAAVQSAENEWKNRVEQKMKVLSSASRKDKLAVQQQWQSSINGSYAALQKERFATDIKRQSVVDDKRLLIKDGKAE